METRHSLKGALRTSVILAAIFFAIWAAADPSFAQSPLTITGIVKTSAGPLKNKVVMFLPYDPDQGKVVAVYTSGKTTLSKEGRRNSEKEPWIYSYLIISKGSLKNARTLTDDIGQFTLTIPDFSRTPPAGSKLKVAIGVFDGTVEAPTTSPYEIEYLEVNPNVANLDAKRLDLKPIKEKEVKP